MSTGAWSRNVRHCTPMTNPNFSLCCSRPARAKQISSHSSRSSSSNVQKSQSGLEAERSRSGSASKIGAGLLSCGGLLASGSPHAQASLRLARACSRALASGTSSAAPAADDEPLDPASGAGRLDEQVQPVPVRVPAGRHGTDEGGRERLVGVASRRLALRGAAAGLATASISPLHAGLGWISPPVLGRPVRDQESLMIASQLFMDRPV